MGLDDRYHEEWETISRVVRQAYQHHCAKCHLNCSAPRNQREALQVHHIDENPDNNAFENLIPLCAKCHLQVEKEARLHAPFAGRQQEIFTDQTYLTTMQAMRQEAYRRYGRSDPPPRGATSMSQEEFEAAEEDWERDWD